MSQHPHAIHDWGYQGRTIDDLLTFARRVGASVVIDVRQNALSRRPGFSKRRLGEALVSAGVQYVHLRGLGNPRDNRPGFAELGTPTGDAARERFRAEVLDSPTGETALSEAARLAQSGPIVVVCFEVDRDRCHRSLVIDALEVLATEEPAYS